MPLTEGRIWGGNAAAPRAGWLKQGISGGFCLKSSATETEWAMMNTQKQCMHDEYVGICMI